VAPLPPPATAQQLPPPATAQPPPATAATALLTVLNGMKFMNLMKPARAAQDRSPRRVMLPRPPPKLPAAAATKLLKSPLPAPPPLPPLPVVRRPKPLPPLMPLQQPPPPPPMQPLLKPTPPPLPPPSLLKPPPPPPPKQPPPVFPRAHPRAGMR
jgi:hypothetical protein